ncbi:MAG: DoxX family protein [Beijerinckiaceae bacterium]|nr:DoxX family protein [Beijerinckiaceae bacterium]MCZ8300793.1 DoxX family protein [Beijerinckiaceae bacterium]
MNNSALTNLALLAGRVLVAIPFVLGGYNKIGGFAGTQKYMEAFGVPGMLLPLVIALELGAGLLLIIGYQTRLAALALAGFTLVAGVLFHGKLSDPMQAILFFKNIAMAGGMLAIFAAGAGAYSLDARRR